MIIGLSIKYFKTYSATNYIPLSNGQSFNGIVGNNGIGKSSVLEALDCLFNNGHFNFNTTVRKSGEETTNPHIVPIFLIKKDADIITAENIEIAQQYSDFIWEIKEEDIISQNREHLTLLFKQFEILKRDNLKDEYYVLPIGINHNKGVDLSFFNVKPLADILKEEIGSGKKIEQVQLEKIFKGLLEDILTYYEYIYIPNDIDPATFTNLENQHIQALMGKTLIDVIAKCVPRSEISKINTNLNKFLKELEDVLLEYSFRTSSDRQLMIRKANVYNLIIEDFFRTRKLHKLSGKHWLDVSLLSSGEKQKAIIDLTQHFLNKYRENSNNIILAIDEPESSLHMSACYEQFNSLFNISEMCSQLLFSTHWYGFIPTISNGNVTVITKDNKNKHCFDLISVSNYREEIKQEFESSKGTLPYDIRLKSLNDFIQSIITSILSNEPFNWLLCEGSSEKKYFEHYFKNEIENKKLRIIPVGGATQIKRIYQNLLVTYNDFKKDVKGTVILLMDTDASLVEFETLNSNHKNLKCFRIVNDDSKNETILVDVNKTPKTPKTEIEDVLCGKTFFDALNKFTGDEDIDKFISTINIDNITTESVYYSLDLSPRKQQALSKIFKKGNFKFEFSEKYIESISEEHIIPKWIEELKQLIK
ncbi:AAA family ATPase [uncultured Formosa sp.]|uniref:AAA family ATPase n=1 Tax=uncultured Formosa sp. TaxID=255435 RepID=UPI00260532F3|nr:AAA family ATPase [uncultured Formosa sp.]